MQISPTHPKTTGYSDSAATGGEQTGSLHKANLPAAKKGADSPGTGATASPREARQDVPDASLEELINELRTIVAAASTKGDNDGVINRRGAPALYASTEDMSINELVMRLLLNTNASQQTMIDFTASSLDNTISKLNRNTQSRIGKQQEINAKVDEAAKQEKTAKVWGWIGKIAAVIGALAAVVVTGTGAVASGGAGTALFVLSVMALVSASLSLADQVSKELGGPEISISNLINHTTVPMLEALGMSRDTAQSIAFGVAALPLVIVEPQLLGTTVEGLCKTAGVSEDTARQAGQVVAMTAAVIAGVVVVGVSILATGGAAAVPLVTKIANGLALGAQLARGGGEIARGTLKISSAQRTKEASDIEADKVDLEADSTLMRKQMDIDQETLKILLQCVQKGTQSVAQIINDLQKSNRQIAQNLARSPV